MAYKTLKLTDDHIRLIKSIKFDEFTIGELLPRTEIVSAMDEIDSNEEASEKFAYLRDLLSEIDRKLDVLSYKKDCYAWGADQWSLFGGTYAMDDIAIAIGKYGDYIKGTENDPMGRQYPKELEDYMWSLYDDIKNNMMYIISLVFQYIDCGGLSAGTYRCKISDKIWEKIG